MLVFIEQSKYFDCNHAQTKQGIEKKTFPNLNIKKQQHSHYLLKYQNKQKFPKEKCNSWKKYKKKPTKYSHTQLCTHEQEHSPTSTTRDHITIENIEIKTTFKVCKLKYICSKGIFFALKWKIDK